MPALCPSDVGTAQKSSFGPSGTPFAFATKATVTVPLGAFAPAPPALGTAPSADRLLYEAHRALRELPGGVPPLLAVDDAHLLDNVSALLVNQLATTRLRGRPHAPLRPTAESSANCRFNQYGDFQCTIVDSDTGCTFEYFGYYEEEGSSEPGGGSAIIC